MFCIIIKYKSTQFVISPGQLLSIAESQAKQHCCDFLRFSKVIIHSIGAFPDDTYKENLKDDVIHKC